MFYYRLLYKVHNKYYNDDKGKNVLHIHTEPFGEFCTLTGINFIKEVFKSPAVTGSTEENVYKATNGKENVRDKIVFPVEYSLTEESDMGNNVVTEKSR